MAASGSREMEIAIKIAGKVESSFKNALSQATKGLGSITKTVASATAAAAAAVGAMGIAAINTGKEFEEAMSQVAATMLIDKTTAEGQKAFETLENAARECGASTAFSATEAAEALNYLALAGYDADKAATALPTVLKLAGAGAMSLAAASNMVTDSMSALGIEATETNLTQFSDQLAQTASKANTSVAQLGEAILTVGGTAKGLAGGTTELNTALGILADNGLKGAEGGTHLRNIILSLQSPTDKAADALKELGVDVYDAQGNMRGLNDVFKDLQGAMDGMSSAQKDNILSTVFNRTDLAAANAMLANCTDRFDELSAAVENSAGACESMYAIQLDNLKGDIDELTSGLEDLGISVYKDLNGPLREMTQLATSMVGELSEAYQGGGMAGMVGAVGDVLAQVVQEVVDIAPDMINMGVSLISNLVQGISDNSDQIAAGAAEAASAFIIGVIEVIPQVLVTGAEVLGKFLQGIAQNMPQIVTTALEAIQYLANGLLSNVPLIIQSGISILNSLIAGLLQAAPLIVNAGVQLILSLVQGLLQSIDMIISGAVNLVLALANGLLSNVPLIINAAVQLVMGLVSGLVNNINLILNGAMALVQGLFVGIINNLPVIVQGALQIITTLATGLIQAIPQLLTAVPQIIGALWEAITSTNWLDLGIQIITALIDGIASMGSSLWDTIKALFTGKEPPDISSTGAETANSYASGINSNAGTVTAAANSMATNAFSSMDTSGATAAGTQAGAAFSTGLTSSMAAGGLDTTAFSANMTAMGTAGATALNTGLSTGIAGTPVDTSGILDAAAFSANMTMAGTQGATAIGTGMTGNSQAVTQAATTLGNDVNTALDGGWNKANTSAQTAMQRLTTTVTDAARSAASAVKAAFENMTITIPKPRIPVINVSTSSVAYGDGGSVSVPNFSVSWNALGGIFDQPTIFNTPAGMQGVGEAGPEAVLPLDTLWAKMKEILNEAIAASGGASLIDAFIEKLKGIGTGGGGGQPELAGAGGPTIQYSPVYNLYGSAGKEEIAEADHMSQAEFNKLMKQYEKDQQRRKL